MKRLLILAMVFMLALPLCAQAEGSMGAWLPYWNTALALDEARQLAPGLDRVMVFAAVFDADGTPMLTDAAASLLLDAQVTFAGSDTAVFLSVVNDWHRGRPEGKSAALLKRLLQSDDAIDAHMDDLLNLLDRTEAEGLELDYEGFGGDRALYAQYTELIARLHEVLAQDGIRLRVVLEWDAAKYADLPEGPEYTVMCYNLFGTHSGPGPKADDAFLDRVAALYREQPGTVRMALACGGYLWQNGKNAKALTQQEAEALLRERGVTPRRDEASGALTAEYREGRNTFTLWYADGETLARWQARLSGFDGTDLFSLGGVPTGDLLNTVLKEQEIMEADK